ncbi:MAG: hypothetical protein HZB31_10570 [Nitrospirae bacterium]|nr:hypothetical protein [Nitrospirota bacterium]
MKRVAAFILFVSLLFSGSAFALGRPDFSGTWTLNMAKSDMGKNQSSTLSTAKVTIVIKQTPAVLATTRIVGERSETATHKLDGGESVNMAGGKEIRSTCRWEGSTLITKSVMSTEHGTGESTFVQSLSADGRVMTIDTTIKTPNGVRKMQLIYDKQ